MWLLINDGLVVCPPPTFEEWELTLLAEIMVMNLPPGVTKSSEALALSKRGREEEKGGFPFLYIIQLSNIKCYQTNI